MMAAKHWTANRYNQGCRCDSCKDPHRLRAADYRQRRAAGKVRPLAAVVPPPAAGASGTKPPEDFVERGPVESGVEVEISGLAHAERLGLVQVSLALARIMDNPRAVNQQPAAAKVLAGLLDKVCAGSARVVAAIWRWSSR